MYDLSSITLTSLMSANGVRPVILIWPLCLAFMCSFGRRRKRGKSTVSPARFNI